MEETTETDTTASETQGTQGTTTPTQDTPTPTTTDTEPKPFLGDNAPAAQEKPQDKPTPATEEDYLKAVVKDEALLGSDKAVQLDGDLIKAMIPTAQELGVSPEALGKMANALAKAQIEASREQLSARAAYFDRMKEESVKRYSPADFSQINAGIDKWFKPGGTMNAVIRSSELGADPEFLALMHYLGGKCATDTLPGASEGGGEGGGDPNGPGGMSKLW